MTVDTATALPECLQVTHQLFYFLDESRYEELVALFTPGGTLHRQGELLVGPLAIMQAMSKRSATQRIRHVISNGFIESQSADLVHLVAYMVAYRFDDGALHTGPVDISRPLRLSVVRAALRQINGGWKIEAMTFTAQFEFVSDAVSADVQP
jgi:hypothetical protein